MRQTITLEEAIKHPKFISCVKEGGVGTLPGDPYRAEMYKVTMKCDTIRMHYPTCYSYEYRDIFGNVAKFPTQVFYILADQQRKVCYVSPDGHAYYEHETYWLVDKNFVVQPFAMYYGFRRPEGANLFDTKGFADCYVELNKPKYSEKQLRDAAESEYKKGRNDERRIMLTPVVDPFSITFKTHQDVKPDQYLDYAFLPVTRESLVWCCRDKVLYTEEARHVIKTGKPFFNNYKDAKEYWKL